MQVQLDEATKMVLTYDLLLGQGVKPHGPLERAFLQQADSLRASAAEVAAAAGATSFQHLASSQSKGLDQDGIRHLRVNVLLATVQEVVSWLAEPPACWPQKHQRSIHAKRDKHLPDVLAVPRAVDLHDHPLVLAGKIALQSRASCMPVHALQLQPGWHVLDCCAAPGNKTSHAAAVVSAAGSVLAFEKDAKRCKLLQRTLDRTHAAHVTVMQKVRTFHAKPTTLSERSQK